MWKVNIFTVELTKFASHSHPYANSLKKRYQTPTPRPYCSSVAWCRFYSKRVTGRNVISVHLLESPCLIGTKSRAVSFIAGMGVLEPWKQYAVFFSLLSCTAFFKKRMLSTISKCTHHGQTWSLHSLPYIRTTYCTCWTFLDADSAS